MYVNDLHTEVQIRIQGLTLTASDGFRIYYRTPSGTKGYWDASLVDTNTVGYRIQLGDIEEIGEWQIQAWVSKADETGWSGFSEVLTISVEDDLIGQPIA